MGRVYLGKNPHDLLVAVKVIRIEEAGTEEYLKRFRSEATNAKRVARFCTAEVLDFNVEWDPPYIVTAYIDGPTLSRHVQKEGPIVGGDLEQLAFVISGALVAIHHAGLVHRDLKPDNVILSSTGPRVIDFGIARATDSNLTRGTSAVGTLGYMAPEQILGRKTTEKADVFAWGATVSFAATGIAPFGRGSGYELQNRTLHKEPDLGRLDLPLRSVVLKSLLKNPDDRPTSDQVRDMLTKAGRQGVGPGGTVDLLAHNSGDESSTTFEIERRILRRLGQPDR